MNPNIAAAAGTVVTSGARTSKMRSEYVSAMRVAASSEGEALKITSLKNVGKIFVMLVNASAESPRLCGCAGAANTRIPLGCLINAFPIAFGLRSELRSPHYGFNGKRIIGAA